MDDQAFKEIFRNSARHGPGPTPHCPEDGLLAAALDGALDPELRAQFESHVADCDHCVARLGRIGRLRHAGGDERVSDISLAKARKLVQKPSITHHVPRWAAAAVVVLAVSSAVRFGLLPQGVESTPPPAPEIRNFDHDAYRPAILFPGNGATIVEPGSLFRWTEVSGSLHYNVRVVSVDGGMIWEERVEDTQWRLPADLRLAEGGEYFFRVDAYLTEAKSVSSRHVLFQVEAPD